MDNFGFRPVIMLPENELNKANEMAKECFERVVQAASDCKDGGTSTWNRNACKNGNIQYYTSSTYPVSILGTTNISATMADMESLLTCDSTLSFKMLMTLLHPTHFVDGAIIRDNFIQDNDDSSSFLSVKWLTYNRRQVCANKPLAFCMLDQARSTKNANGNRITTRIMTPYDGQDFSIFVSAPSYTQSSLHYGMVVEEIHSNRVKVSCIVQSNFVENKAIASNLVKDTLLNIEKAIEISKISIRVEDRRLHYHHPSKKSTTTNECKICDAKFSVFKTSIHCRICKRCVCKHCALQTPLFLQDEQIVKRVSICTTCITSKAKAPVVLNSPAIPVRRKLSALRSMSSSIIA